MYEFYTKFLFNHEAPILTQWPHDHSDSIFIEAWQVEAFREQSSDSSFQGWDGWV